MVPHGNVRKERHRQGEGAIRQGVRLTQSGRAQRILPPVHVDDGTAALLDQVLQHDGEALNIFGALANHPAVLRRYSALGGSLLQKGSLPARSRELMILRVAYRSSCDYEFAHHSVIAAAAGLTEAEVKALVGAGEFDWPGADLALISLVDELLDSWSVSDETWGLLCDYDPKDLVELVTLVGFYAMTAMLNKALLIQLENGLEPLPHSTA